MKNSHSTTELFYHLVLVTKFRQKFDFNVEIVKSECEKQFAKKVICNAGNDHIHILFELSPNISISYFVNRIKSNLSRYFNKTNNRKPIKQVWPDFQTGYFCKSVGSSALSEVKKYIENQ